jgi:DNA-directed RNA polymerase specialized sigma24 family protein
MRHRDQTDMGGSREDFLTTHWSLIDGTATDRHRDRALIKVLIERYWKPVYCYLRRKGRQNEEAKDLTQSFFHEIVLCRRLLERADRSRGRFRTFLLHALDQFLIDQKRKETARKRIPIDKLVPLDVSNLPELPEAALCGSDADCFTYVWKSTLVDQTLSEVSASCQEQGLGTHWSVFEERVLQPIYHNVQPPSMREICARYGIETESIASNMLVTIKRRFQEALRRNLRLTILSEDEVDDELRDMLDFFGKSAQETSNLPG